MTVSNEVSLLPKWAVTELSEISVKLVDGSHNPPSKQESGFPMLSARNIENGQIVLHEFRLISPRDFAQEDTRTRVRPGDVLLTIVGSIGRAAVVGHADPAMTLQRSVAVITPCEVDSKFLMYQFQSPGLQGVFEREARGTAQKGIYLRVLGRLPILLAPLPEQRRIVAAIETQFTRLDASVAALGRARANLKRYRAAVLKAACEGRLVPTEAELARAEGRGFEPASELLERMAAERDGEGAHGGALGSNSGRRGNRSGAPGRAPLNLVDDLPEGWTRARAEQLCGFKTKGTTPSADKLFDGMGNVPFIKVYNLTHRGVLDFSVKPTFISMSTHAQELARSRVIPGDVLMNIVGPPLGKVAIVPETYEEWNMNQAIAVFRARPGYDRRFLSLCLRSEGILAWAVRRAKATAGQFNLTLEICRDLPLPVPPFAEQQRIVAEVERRLSVVEEMEAAIRANLKRAERLRQAILRRAFAGRLVAQDPTDEPASVLLERIRAERRAKASMQPKRTRGRKRQAVQPPLL